MENAGENSLLPRFRCAAGQGEQVSRSGNRSAFHGDRLHICHVEIWTSLKGCVQSGPARQDFNQSARPTMMVLARRVPGPHLHPHFREVLVGPMIDSFQ